VVVVGSAVVVGVGRVVGIVDCAVVLGATVVKMVSDGAVVLGEAVAARVSGVAVGCVVSLLVAQAVAVSAAMARTGTLSRCLINIALAVFMSLDDNTPHTASKSHWI